MCAQLSTQGGCLGLSNNLTGETDMLTYFKISPQEKIMVFKDDAMSEQATKAVGRKTNVFTTLNTLEKFGGAMAFLDDSDQQVPTIILSSIRLDRNLRQAVLHHEIGHLVNGDVNTPDDKITDRVRTLAEFAADHYMAGQVGKFKAIMALSDLSRMNPNSRDILGLRTTALLLGKWSWRFFQDGVTYL